MVKNVYDIGAENLLERYGIATPPAGNRGTRSKVTYRDVVCGFDIETSIIPEIEESIMYVWQFQLGLDLTVIGRTWQEYVDFITRLLGELGEEKLVVYVHNLSYEFQFLWSIFEFNSDDVFCVKSRKILKATWKNVEYRCAYLHSNMSLFEYTNKMDVEHKKLDGDEYDYNKMRFPWDELSEKELEYCVNDVLGLVECIYKEMELDGDTIYTIPLTSTGYVRRDAKEAMRQYPRTAIENMLPDPHIYEMCRKAFRGGNTHANRYYAGKIIKNVHSADRSSSYPDVQCNDMFPMSGFVRRGEQGISLVEKWIFERGKAILMEIELDGLCLKDEYWGCPYLSFDKCYGVVDPVLDNGRILSAASLITTITDIDYRILLEEYEWEDIYVLDSATARYGRLPAELREVTIGYYRQKTSLKGIPGQEVYYTKAKNKLNSIYGMQAQNPVKDEVVFKNGLYNLRHVEVEEELYRTRGKQFMPYQWGVWVTAWARYRLEEGIRLAGEGFVYTDTDSVKYVGNVDWDKYNEVRKRCSKNSGAYAKDSHGHYHYMGVYEREEDMDEFRTWGAKKYAYRIGEKLNVTVSGVVKKYSADELGDIRNFEPDFVFIKAGGLEAKYNDHAVEELDIDGHKILLPSNVALLPSTYKLGITNEYDKLLTNI